MTENLLVNSYDSALEYVSEHSTADVDHMDQHPATDTYLCEFAGAFTGAIVGFVIKKVRDVTGEAENKIIKKIPDGHILQNTNMLPPETLNYINRQLIKRTYNNIKKFNAECKNIIAHTDANIENIYNNQIELSLVKKKYNKYTTENPMVVSDEFKKYLNVITEKTPEFFSSTESADINYNKKHNVPSPPKTIQYEWPGKIEGSGKIGNFIMKIPVVAISWGFGGGGGGGGGCSIL